MVPAGNKARRLSSANHTTKTIYHHHHHHQCTLLVKGRRAEKNVALEIWLRRALLLGWGAGG